MSESRLSPGNLPFQIASFVGRRHEKLQVRSALREHRLVTIVGPGGVGKTRLAVEAAGQEARSYAGGCWFADLGSHPAHQAVVARVATALGVTRSSGEWSAAELAARLDDRRTLLVIDNCEHVLEEVAAFVRDMLRDTADVDVLATSRQALGVAGEQLVHLDGLTYPEEGRVESLAELAGLEGVDLFIQRGRLIVPELVLAHANAQAVADIVRRVEGLPLAIELAAARLRVLAPQQIAKRLEDQFRLLRSTRVTDDRHRTLRATIEWSYDLCSPLERLCWARLSVFPADFDLEAAESVASGGSFGPDDVLGLVGALIDKSVLRTLPGSGPSTRYRFTDPVRDFGRDKAAELDPDDMSGSRHLEYFSELAGVVPYVLFGPSQVEHTGRLRAELPNLGAALLRAVAEAEADAADTLACAIALVSFSSGALSDSRAALDTALRSEGSRSTARVRLLVVSAWLAINQGDLPLARQQITRCRVLAQLIGDRHGLVHALEYLGQCELLEDEVGAAARHCRDAVRLARDLGDDHALATSLVRQAQVFEALGETGKARAALGEAIAISDRVGEKWCRGYALWNLALLLEATGCPKEGMRRARAALDSKALFEDIVGVAQGLEAMAWCSAGLDEPSRAAVLLGAADAVWTSSGAVLPARLVPRREHCEARIIDALGRESYLALRGEGQELTPDDAVGWRQGADNTHRAMPQPAEARATTGTRPRAVADDSPLTAREREVALLVAEGRKNREIASLLVISPRTVETHVDRILTKLGFISRAQIGSWAAYLEDN